MKDLLVSISDFLYKWVLTAPNHPEYKLVFSNAPGGGCGMMWTFVLLLIISLASVAFFYFVTCKSVSNANKKNYFTVCGLGLLTLVLATIVGLRLITGYDGNDYWGENLLMLNLVNVLYYAVLFEVWSLVLKGSSNAPYIHMFSK